MRQKLFKCIGCLAPNDTKGQDGYILAETIIAISIFTLIAGFLIQDARSVLRTQQELEARTEATFLAKSLLDEFSLYPSTELTDRTSKNNNFNWSLKVVQPTNKQAVHFVVSVEGHNWNKDQKIELLGRTKPDGSAL